MQLEQHPAKSIRRPTRLIKYPYPSTLEAKAMAPTSAGAGDLPDIASQPTTQITLVNSTHLMHLSGMMQAIRIPTQPTNHQSVAPVLNEEGFWPNGIQQTGPLPVVNLYGSEPFGRTVPTLPKVSTALKAP